ncbi:MAG: type and secretion system protein [Bryobacterales bacterium]|nr:type and secretion system protein [Bryobacterales bacterium]
MTRNFGATSRKRALGRSLPPALLALAGLLGAQDRIQPGAEPMKLSVGRSIVLDRSSDVARISISNPEVVDAVAVTTREILVNAKSAGLATIVMWSKAGERNVYAVTVVRDLEPIRRLLKDTFPGEAIDVRADGDSLSLIGHASSQPVADRAMALVAPFVKVAVNNLQVVPPGADKQIVLRVRFAEVNRNVITSFGVNLLSTGALNTPFRISTQQFGSGSPSELRGQIPGHAGGTSTTFSLSDVLNIFAFRPDLNLGAIIRDLQTQGLLQILAEPNLVTTNGKEASFLVGGEFPIPVLQGGTNNAVTIQFREFGIRLNFLPQVTAHNTIKLHVKPEISTIDLANGVVFSGFTIPALATRRMETDIELGEGQTFVIGGLLDDRVTESLSKVPGLSHIPILGALFKSRSENKSKTELIVMVTPETTYPFSATDAKPMPHMLKEFLPDAPSHGHSDKNTPPRAGVNEPVSKSVPDAAPAADLAPDATKPAKEIDATPGKSGAR